MLKTTSLTRPIAKVTHVSVAQMKLHFGTDTLVEVNMRDGDVKADLAYI